MPDRIPVGWLEAFRPEVCVLPSVRGMIPLVCINMCRLCTEYSLPVYIYIYFFFSSNLFTYSSLSVLCCLASTTCQGLGSHGYNSRASSFSFVTATNVVSACGFLSVRVGSYSSRDQNKQSQEQRRHPAFFCSSFFLRSCGGAHLLFVCTICTTRYTVVIIACILIRCSRNA